MDYDKKFKDALREAQCIVKAKDYDSVLEVMSSKIKQQDEKISQLKQEIDRLRLVFDQKTLHFFDRAKNEMRRGVDESRKDFEAAKKLYTKYANYERRNIYRDSDQDLDYKAEFDVD